MKQIDINVENIGINTEYCFDSNGSDEFKCECNDGFDGKRCEDECSLDCGIHGNCTTEINTTTGIKQWKCLCNDNFTGFNSHSSNPDTSSVYFRSGVHYTLHYNLQCMRSKSMSKWWYV